jgi:hypothetical protein
MYFIVGFVCFILGFWLASKTKGSIKIGLRQNINQDYRD